MKACPSAAPMAWIGTTFSCASFAAARASRWKRWKCFSSSVRCWRSTLSATLRPRFFCSASYTTAMPPRPSTRPSRKSPSSSPSASVPGPASPLSSMRKQRSSSARNSGAWARSSSRRGSSSRARRSAYSATRRSTRSMDSLAGGIGAPGRVTDPGSVRHAPIRRRNPGKRQTNPPRLRQSRGPVPGAGTGESWLARPLPQPLEFARPRVESAAEESVHGELAAAEARRGLARALLLELTQGDDAAVRGGERQECRAQVRAQLVARGARRRAGAGIGGVQGAGVAPGAALERHGLALSLSRACGAGDVCDHVAGDRAEPAEERAVAGERGRGEVAPGAQEGLLHDVLDLHAPRERTPEAELDVQAELLGVAGEESVAGGPVAARRACEVGRGVQRNFRALYPTLEYKLGRSRTCRPLRLTGSHLLPPMRSLRRTSSGSC